VEAQEIFPAGQKESRKVDHKEKTYLLARSKDISFKEKIRHEKGVCVSAATESPAEAGNQQGVVYILAALRHAQRGGGHKKKDASA